MSPAIQFGCRISDPGTGSEESYGYLNVEGEQLFVAHHHASGAPKGAVIICGPIGAERERALRTLVDLARTLAKHGYNVLRFDYRGVGESTGSFDKLCLSDWRTDIEHCIAYVRHHGLTGAGGLALWGARAGATLAAECFRAGAADAVMLCAPMGGRPHLQDLLRRTLVAEMLFNPQARRTTREECIARLEKGECVNVDGYFWSRRLWEDAAHRELILPEPDETRPWRVLDFKGLPRTALPAWAEPNREIDTGDRFWEGGTAILVPRSTILADRTVEWLRPSLKAGG